MKNNINDLGILIKRQRIISGLTLSQLGIRSGISPSYLWRIERGKRFPSAHTLRKIAKPLDFDEAELFYFVAKVLASEPVATRRTASGIISVLKEITRVKK